MDFYDVKRTDGTECIVTLIRDKTTQKYHYVNLTKEHICPCAFDTVEDALMDLEKLISSRRVKEYKNIGNLTLKND